MTKTANDFFTLENEVSKLSEVENEVSELKRKCFEFEFDYSKILPTNDLIFKRIFWNKDHPDILICFLNAVLKREDPITSVELISTEFDNQFILDHGIRMDLLGRTNNGELLNIEMQKKNNGDMYKRTLYYWAKLYYSQLPKGEKYGVLNPVIVINILDFNLFKDNRCHRSIVLKDNDTNEEYLDRMLDMHFVELRKRENINNNDALRAWMEFLKSPNSASVNNKKEIIPEIEKAKDVYNEAIADPEEQAKIRAIEKAESDKATEIGFAEAKGIAKGLAEGKKEGLAEGEHKKAIETAKNFLKMGLSIEQVAQGTGLSIDEIKKL